MAKSGKRGLKERFLDWQCEVRQTAMRADGGRPSEGMCPKILDEQGHELVPALTVLLAPKDPEESTAFFRFQVMKSADPRETYEKALRFLQSDYFQDSKLFSGRLLSVLPSDAPLADTLIATNRCVLDFGQGRHGFRVPCKVKILKADDANRDAAIWHNRVFNPALAETARVLSFKPDWKTAEIKT